MLLALYPEADSLSWQSNSWLCMNNKLFNCNWVCLFVLYKVEISVSTARDLNLDVGCWNKYSAERYFPVPSVHSQRARSRRVENTLGAEGQSSEVWTRWEMKVFYTCIPWWSKIRSKDKRQVSNLTVCPSRSVLRGWKCVHFEAKDYRWLNSSLLLALLATVLIFQGIKCLIEIQVAQNSWKFQ